MKKKIGRPREFKRINTVWKVTQGKKTATVELVLTPYRPFGKKTDIIDLDPSDDQFRRVVKALGYTTSRKDFFERDDLGGTSFDLLFSPGGLDVRDFGNYVRMRMECISHKRVGNKLVPV